MARGARAKGSSRRVAGVEIRPARRADLPALARLGAALVRQHHAMDPRRFFLEEPLEEGYAWFRPTMAEMTRELGVPDGAEDGAKVARQRRRG